MCTVTFVANSHGFILTSNRDETTQRGRAIEPNEYLGNHKKLVYPKDPKANGTWTVHDYSNCAILLNGAEEKHDHKDNYRKSRGLILLDIFDSKNPIESWKTIDLFNIEPFTIVLFFQGNLYQLRWNEIKKTCKPLAITKSYIWSSSTLYTKEIQKKREELFQEYLQKYNPNKKTILDFHQFKDDNNEHNTIVIKRNEHLKTVSITQFHIENNQIDLTYIDLFE
jgi:hypothetical protein